MGGFSSLYINHINTATSGLPSQDFFRAHHVPKSLKRRMQEHFQTTWSLNNGVDTAEVIRDFPDEMKGEIAVHLYRDMLALPVFSSASQGCMKAIAQQVSFYSGVCDPPISLYLSLSLSLSLSLFISLPLFISLSLFICLPLSL